MPRALSDKEKAAMSRNQSEQLLFARIQKMGDWPERGVCRTVDPDMWFPDQGDGRAHRKAKEICSECPVVAECREWAINSREPYGVWGGLSATERARLWRSAA